MNIEQENRTNMTKRTKVLTPLFRVSFPSVFSPEKPMKNADGTSDPKKKSKYGLTMIFDPSTFSADDKRRFQNMRELVDATSIEHFKKPLKDIPGSRKPFRDGAEKEYEGYGAGKIFAKASSFSKPGIVSSDGRTPIDDEEAFHSGVLARATVTAYKYNHLGNKGVSFGLSNVMLVKDDGTRYDSRTDPADDFGEVAVESDPADDYSDMV